MTKAERCENLERVNDQYAANPCHGTLIEFIGQITLVLLDMNKPTKANIPTATLRELAMFDEARKLFPGVKRGNDTEFTNYRKKHKDWKKYLPDLLGCVAYQISERKALESKGDWVPPQWCAFSVWINERRFERSMQ